MHLCGNPTAGPGAGRVNVYMTACLNHCYGLQNRSVEGRSLDILCTVHGRAAHVLRAFQRLLLDVTPPLSLGLVGATPPRATSITGTQGQWMDRADPRSRRVGNRELVLK